MSEESKEKDAPKINAITKSKKVKNPKRVEAGKRLAAISKEIKEKKMRKRMSAEKTLEDGYAKSEYLIGLAGVAIAAVTLYLAYNKTEPVKTIALKEEEKEKEIPRRIKPISLTEKPVLDMFDE